MKNNISTFHPAFVPGDGQTMRERLNNRTHILAANGGRALTGVSQSDYEQAKRDVTGESDLELQNAILELPPVPLLQVT